MLNGFGARQGSSLAMGSSCWTVEVEVYLRMFPCRSDGVPFEGGNVIALPAGWVTPILGPNSSGQPSIEQGRQ